jgi:iron complex transport system substrate-binding protein
MKKPRIVSFCPSNTELLFAMGLGDCVVGVDNYSDYPEEVKTLPKVGPDLHVDVQKVQSLEPDLVLCSLSVPGMEHVVQAISDTGIRYITLSPHSIEDILLDIDTIASAVYPSHTPDHVKQLSQNARDRVESIREGINSLQTSSLPRLYWEWWSKPVYSPGGRNWLTEVSALAGAINIFADVDADSVCDDGKRVIAQRPDYALFVWTGIPQHKVPLQKLLQRRHDGWDQTPAYQLNHIYVLSEGLYCRPSLRLIDGLEQLTALLHPDIAARLHLPALGAHGPIRMIDGTWISS